MISSIGSWISPIASELAGAVSGSTTPQTTGANFSDLFRSAVEHVDSLQGNADQQITNMIQGGSNVDMGQVSISVEKADIAFQLMMQVRNKVISAYQDMEKMQF